VTTPITTPFKWETTAAEVVAGIDLAGCRVIVTGGASGIGRETARALATTGAEVTLAVRDADAGKRVASDIEATTGNTHILVAPVDLADPASVASFVAAWDGPLNVLINNAGVMACPQTRTPQGWELQFATNHLGHFALAAGLHRALAAASGAASSRSAPEPTCARRWSSTTSISSTAPTSRGTLTHNRRPPTCCSWWRRPGAGEATASPPTRCSRAPSGPTCSATPPTRTWSAPADTSKTTMGASTGRPQSRAPQPRCCSRAHRCSRESAAATSKTATKQDQASPAPVVASPPTRSTLTRRRGSGRSPCRRWHPDDKPRRCVLYPDAAHFPRPASFIRSRSAITTVCPPVAASARACPR
jgi:NAD(P)-dependent dehydrogenase (short-subunit alcohol dehydrogenase family)